MMLLKRRHLLRGAGALGLFAATGPLFGCTNHAAGAPTSTPPTTATGPVPPAAAIQPPAQGAIPVAFVISDGAVIIDFCGPWEVFEGVHRPDNTGPAFQLYTVGPSTQPIRASGGMQIVPDYTVDNAPPPKVIVIPAQHGASEAMLAWIRTQSAATDVTMSVCTGAFVLAKTGLLDGKRATTYHNAFDAFEAEHPDVKLLRGLRFVDDGNVSSAGGLSSGIDLALHVVERYYGRDVATAVAYDLEYQGPGWRDPSSNNVYATMAKPKAQPGHVLCPVCGMDADPKTAPSSVYAGKTYYFCSPDDKQTFDAAPAKFAAKAPG